MTLNNVEGLLNILRVYSVIDDDDMCYCVWSHGCCVMTMICVIVSGHMVAV